MATTHSSGLTKFRIAALTAVCALLVALGAMAVTPAQGTNPPTPTAISATASTDNTGLGGAVPDVLVQAARPLNLTVTLQPYGAAFRNATRLTLTPTLTSGETPNGKLNPQSVLMPAGVNSATFSVKYSAPDNGVQITVAKAYPQPFVAPGTTAPFDVLKALTTFNGDDPRLQTGLGIGNLGCGQNTTEPACGRLILKNGTASQLGALSLGPCTADLGCTPGSQIVQAIADLGELYDADHPAQLIYRCDKLLCFGKGVNYYSLKVSFDVSGPLDLVAQPCVTKGVARDAYGNDFCLDYRSSHRDNAGDLLLVLLFTHDMRAST